ncbi:MAG: hypothetical protein ABI681_00265 [Gemmatimonadales bacterium]
MPDTDDLVPISDLFFDGPGPHVVRAGFTSQTAAEAKFTPARGLELRALLNTSISQLGAVSGETRRRTPTPIPLPPPVDIDTLVYRGRAALERAVEIRNEIRNSGRPPRRSAIEELLDLVEQAAKE